MLAKRYASALIDLAIEDKTQDEVSGQLAAFASIFEASGLSKALQDPQLGADEKKALLEEVAGKLKLDALVKNFLLVLLKNKRVSEISPINDLFQVLLDERSGRVKAEVTLPGEVDKKEIEDLRKGLEASTGKKVTVHVTVDPSMIGGVVTRVGSIVYDGSIRTQLENIKNSIMRG